MDSLKIRKIALSGILTALAIVIAPWLWFPVLGSKAYPGQHLINSIAGVLLGPWWAALIALFTGIIRIMLGIGTIYSIPGGIPGGVIVGIFYNLFKKTKLDRQAEIAALLEPIGTIFIGGTIAFFIVAPMINDFKTMAKPLIVLWIGWAVSSVPGAASGFVILKFLKKANIFRKFLFKEL